MTKAKRNLSIVIITLASVMVFLSVYLLVINVIEMVGNKKILVEAAYYFNNQNGALKTSDADYKNNSVFYISSPRGLNSFSNSVKNGCHFSEKTVYLSTDIDMSGQNFQPIGADMNTSKNELNGTSIKQVFNGTFDGRGHKVYNLTTTIDDSPWNEHFYLGFFAILAQYAVVQNLKIQNFKIDLNEDDGYAWTGAIAGWAMSDGHDVQIKNCMVDGFRTESVVKRSTHAGVVGWADGGTNASWNNRLRMENIHLKDFTASVKDSSVNSICPSAIYALTNYVIQNSTGELNTNNPDANINGWTGSKFSANDNIRNSTGGSNVGTTWYYGGPSYNSGYPVLRSFVSWTTIIFKSSNETYGSVDKFSIQAPTDASTSFDDYNNSTSTTITLFTQTIKATITSTGMFVKWAYNTSTATYTANFKVKPYKIRFLDGEEAQYGLNLAKIIYKAGSGTFSTLTGTELVFEVDGGSQVSLKFLNSYDGVSFSKADAFAAAQFTFTGNKVTNGIVESTAKSYTVIIVLTSSDYYLSSVLSTITTDQTFEINSAKLFSADYKLRDYDLGII